MSSDKAELSPFQNWFPAAVTEYTAGINFAPGTSSRTSMTELTLQRVLVLCTSNLHGQSMFQDHNLNHNVLY